MTIERKNYPQLGEPIGPYVHAVKHQGVLYLSGLTAFGTPAQSGGTAEQVSAIFDQVMSVAEAEGAGMNDLLKVTVFVTSFDEVDALRDALFTAYEGALPASSLVQVGSLFAPDLNVEIEAMLAVP